MTDTATNSDSSEKWYHPAMEEMASKLSTGVLNEMKRRITTSNIKKEKLELNENTDRMRSFFERELSRYTKRKEALQQRSAVEEQLQTRISKLIDDNATLEMDKMAIERKNVELHKLVQRQFKLINQLAEKCKSNNIAIDSLISVFVDTSAKM